MIRLGKAVLCLLFVGFIFGVIPSFAKTQEEIKREIEDYEKELTSLSQRAKTLSNQIAQFDVQINLTLAKIAQTQEKILLLGGRIDQLEGSLSSLSNAFSSRAKETYKIYRLGDPALFLIASSDLSEAVSRFYYLQRIQKEDYSLMVRLTEAQGIYKEQKKSQEDLGAVLNKEKGNLAAAKIEKANLLSVTRSDEKRYQQLVSSARAELAVILGKGKETFVRDVSEGALIGRMIPQLSGCSSGKHLHFEVHEGDSIKDPNSYLTATSFGYSYGSDKYGYYGTVNPSGSLRWPVDSPIVINQGFGSHGFAKTFYPGGVHNGIDIDSDGGTSVYSVKGGKLYAGNYSCGGAYPGTLLYAKIDHGGGLTTWYLHITPQ